MKITRRDFMKVAGVVGAAAALAGCSGMAPGAETATSTAASTAASAAGSVAAATGSMELSGPIQLTFAAQEVGTAAYNYAAALQSVMLPELPAGSTIDITTTSPGGVGAPVIVNAGEECDLVMSNAGPAKWSYEKSTSEYEFGGCTEIACLAGGLGQNFINIMFTQKFVDATGYKTFEEVVADKYPVKMVIKKNGSFGEQTAEKVCEALGITFDDICIDRSMPDDNAPTRKPRTGMLTKYLDNPDYDLSHSFVIGDRPTDVELAKNLGCRAILLQDDMALLKPISEGGSAACDGLKDYCALATKDWDKVAEFLFAGERTAEVRRTTKETDIYVSLNLDGDGYCDIVTGLGFFDHMLEQIGKHGGMDLTIHVKGDLEVDEHHTIEDTALALGD